MARSKSKPLAITAETFDEILGKNYGPDLVQVIPGRAVHWPDSSEIRANPGDVLFAKDPWLGGQGHKVIPYEGEAKPSTPKSILTRQRLQLLEAVLAEKGKEAPKAAPARSGTRGKKASANKAAGREALESAAKTDGDDGLVGLDA